MKRLDFKRKYPTYFTETVTSTNDALKAMSGKAEYGCALIAASQSAGRGRLSRSFLSPAGGLYMSVLYRPQAESDRLYRLTAAAAVAVRRTIERECGVACAVKWPNDIVCEGKKLCGILTETVWRGERADVIVGIGVNVNAQSFPEELRELAVSVRMLTGKEFDISSLAEALLGELDCETEKWQSDPTLHLEEYRKNCITVGREISAGGRRGRALGVGEDYSLTVRFEDGSTESLSFGEISVRGIYGYM